MSAVDLDAGENGRLRYEVEQIDEFSNNYSISTTSILQKPSFVIGNSREPIYGINHNTYHYMSLENAFHVDHRGVLSVRQVIDRELNEFFKLKVSAIDHGPQPYTSTTFVRIEVIDQNDEKPQFEKNTYVFSLSENKTLQNHIGSVKAVDKDGPKFNGILYSFETGLSDLNNATPLNISLDNHFGLNIYNGDLYLLKVLDREIEDTYRFSVVAFDPKNSSMSAVTLVIIKVTDVNDNPPHFSFPTYYNFTAILQLKAPPTTPHFIARVQATDADEGDNAVILYDLICVRRISHNKYRNNEWFTKNDNLIYPFFNNHSQNSKQLQNQLAFVDYSQYFHLDHKSGTILMMSKPPFVSDDAGNLTSHGAQTRTHEQAYELTIMIRDNGKPHFSNTSRLLVIVRSDMKDSSVSYSSPYLFNLNRSMHILIISLLLLFSAFVCVLLVIFTACVFRKRKKMSSLATVATIGCDGNMFSFDNEKHIEEKMCGLVNEVQEKDFNYNTKTLPCMTDKNFDTVSLFPPSEVFVHYPCLQTHSNILIKINEKNI